MKLNLICRTLLLLCATCGCTQYTFGQTTVNIVGTCSDNNTPNNPNDDNIVFDITPCTGSAGIYVVDNQSGLTVISEETGAPVVFGPCYNPARLFQIQGAIGGGTVTGIRILTCGQAPICNLVISDPGVPCSVPVPCSIDLVEAVPSSCNVTNNDYSVAVTFDYTSAPTNEDIVFTFSNGEIRTFTPSAEQGTETVVFAGFTSMAQAVSVNAAFATTTSCAAPSAVNYTEPAQCFTPLCDAADGDLGGFAFLDLDSDGLRSGGPGEEGITVEVYSSAGSTPVCTTTTDANGAWVCTGLNPSETYRVEFSLDGVAGLVPSRSAVTGNTTDVQFASPGTCGVNFAVIDPAQACSDDSPPVLVTCMVAGLYNLSPAGEPGLLSFEYGATGSGGVTTLIDNNEIGSVYGASYDRERDVIYAAAFAKRHVGIGPDGYGHHFRSDCGRRHGEHFHLPAGTRWQRIRSGHLPGRRPAD